MPLFNLHPKETTKELFGRDNEIEELVSLIRAKRRVVILGPRMVGKTSLVKATNKNWKTWASKQFTLTFFGGKGTHGLLKALAQGLNQERSIVQKIRAF